MLLKLLKYEGMVLGRLLLPFDLLCFAHITSLKESDIVPFHLCPESAFC